jgi:hypothetical protein
MNRLLIIAKIREKAAEIRESAKESYLSFPDKAAREVEADNWDGVADFIENLEG